MKRKFLIAVASLMMLMMSFAVLPHSALADKTAIVAEAAGDSIANATSISLGTQYNGYITSTNEKDVYKFILPSSGRISLAFKAKIEHLHIRLYDENGEQLWSADPYWNGTVEQIALEEFFDLTKGTYYLAIERNYEYYGSYNFNLTFKSAGESFPEPQNGNNNSIATANTISLDKGYKGQIAKNDVKDVYKFSLSSSGRINMTFKAGMERVYLYLYDEDGNELWYTTLYWNSTTKQISFADYFDLTKGTYYFAVSDSYNTGNYNFKISFKGAGESFSEPQGGSNNSVETANAISAEKSYNGQIAKNDSKDVYKFSLSSSGRINITFKAGLERVYLYLYDEDGNELWYTTLYWNSTTKQISFADYFDLTKGTYYFAVSDSYNTGNYNFKISFKSAGESFSEPKGGDNNSIAQADSIVVCKTYKGQIATNDDKDLYVLKLSSSGKVKLTFKASMENVYLNIYDKNGNGVWESYQYWNSTSGQISFSEVLVLQKGKYYFAVTKYSGKTGNYSFNFNDYSQTTATSISKCTFSSIKSATYTGKAIKPTLTVKNGKTTLKAGTHYTVSYKNNTNIGKATVTIKGVSKNGYTGTKTITFNILPGTTKSLKATQTTSSVKLTWSKVNGATGYRVFRYDTKSKKWVKLADTKNTTYTVSKLKAGTNYKYAVKAYTAVGKTIYWSASFAQLLTATRPATPAIKVTAGKKQATVSWNKVTGATGYVVYYSSSKNGEYRKLATVKGTSYTAKKLTTGKNAYFKVAAYKTVNKANIYSSNSAVKSVKVK